MIKQEILAAYPAALETANKLLGDGDMVLKVSKQWRLTKWAYDSLFQQYLFHYSCPTQNVQLHAWCENGKWHANFDNRIDYVEWQAPL